MSTDSVLRKCANAFLLAGAMVLSGYGILYVQAHVYLAREKQQFESQLRSKSSVAQPGVSQEATSPCAVVKDGSVIGELEIPRIGVQALVLEGVDAGILRRAIGHVPGTAMPGEPGGNVAVAAHRNTLFHPLRFIRRNDLIRIETVAGTVSYRVESMQIVDAHDIAVLHNTGKSKLTLVTCYPFYYVGAAPRRFIVQAAEISEQHHVRATAM
jgi:sortase A